MAYSILFFSIASMLLPLALSNPVSPPLLRALINPAPLQGGRLIRNVGSSEPNSLPWSVLRLHETVFPSGLLCV